MTDLVEIVGLDHVQLLMPPGGEPNARWFYVEVLGLREAVKPAALRSRGGCWFVGVGTAIHLSVDTRFTAAHKAHPAFVVVDLDVARRVIVASGGRIIEDDSGLDVRRCYTEDPFGNRIELIDGADAGFSDRA